MFRHTFATDLLEKGTNPVVIKELSGHEHIQTTLEIYSHPSKEFIRSEMKKRKVASSSDDKEIIRFRYRLSFLKLQKFSGRYMKQKLILLKNEEKIQDIIKETLQGFWAGDVWRLEECLFMMPMMSDLVKIKYVNLISLEYK